MYTGVPGRRGRPGEPGEQGELRPGRADRRTHSPVRMRAPIQRHMTQTPAAQVRPARVLYAREIGNNIHALRTADLSADDMVTLVSEARTVHAAVSDGTAGNLTDVLRAIATASVVLSRRDCPVEAKIIVVTVPGFPVELVNRVLSDPALPDEVRVAHALAQSGRPELIRVVHGFVTVER